jgi:eukaryotic-like serine/threonine-protein kinase
MMPPGAEHLTESDRHAANLAASVYGVDRARLKQALQAMAQAKAQGKKADLLDLLVGQKALTANQAGELRLALDATHLDPDGPPRPPGDAVPLVQPGSVFELRHLDGYRILRRLGEGGMGAVYLAYDDPNGRQVALKVLPDHLATNQGYVDRFYREARSGSALDHPNIVRCIGANQDEETGKHYLVLEYVDGFSAHALLQRFGRLSVGDATHIALDIARALEHAHARRIVHRDIKPDNILLTQSGVAKLSDLGLAKRVDEASHLTAARQGFGTPYYMPYEQAMNAKYADGRSDIYALGATLYHLVTGEIPFAGANHLEIVEKKNLGVFTPASARNPEVPAALDRILGKMLARDPEDRYQTASELIVDLERAKLAAAVPSFIDPNLALADPLVRARLEAPAEPTRPDLEASPVNGSTDPENPHLWFVRYRNRDGRWCKVRLTTEQITQRLREGRLVGTVVEASHQSQGEFQPLTTFAEFRAALAAAKRAKRVRENGKADKKEPRPDEKRTTPQSRFLGFRLWLLSGLGFLALLGLGLYLAWR